MPMLTRDEMRGRWRKTATGGLYADDRDLAASRAFVPTGGLPDPGLGDDLERIGGGLDSPFVAAKVREAEEAIAKDRAARETMAAAIRQNREMEAGLRKDRSGMPPPNRLDMMRAEAERVARQIADPMNDARRKERLGARLAELTAPLKAIETLDAGLAEVRREGEFLTAKQLGLEVATPLPTVDEARAAARTEEERELLESISRLEERQAERARKDRAEGRAERAELRAEAGEKRDRKKFRMEKMDRPGELARKKAAEERAEAGEKRAETTHAVSRRQDDEDRLMKLESELARDDAARRAPERDSFGRPNKVVGRLTPEERLIRETAIRDLRARLYDSKEGVTDAAPDPEEAAFVQAAVKKRNPATGKPFTEEEARAYFRSR